MPGRRLIVLSVNKKENYFLQQTNQMTKQNNPTHLKFRSFAFHFTLRSGLIVYCSNRFWTSFNLYAIRVEGNRPTMAKPFPPVDFILFSYLLSSHSSALNDSRTKKLCGQTMKLKVCKRIRCYSGLMVQWMNSNRRRTDTELSRSIMAWNRRDRLHSSADRCRYKLTEWKILSFICLNYGNITTDNWVVDSFLSQYLNLKLRRKNKR